MPPFFFFFAPTASHGPNVKPGGDSAKLPALLWVEEVTRVTQIFIIE